MIKKYRDELKVYFYLLCIVFSVTLSNSRILMIVLILLFINMAIVRVPAKYFIGRIKYGLVFGGGILLIPLPFTKGWLYTGIIALKFFISIISCITMIYSVKINKFLNALRIIKVSNIILSIIEFNIRYIKVLKVEANRMYMARISRSYKKKRFLNFKDLKDISQMVAILFVRSYERSNRIYTAMKSRGYVMKIDNPRVKGEMQIEQSSGDKEFSISI